MVHQFPVAPPTTQVKIVEEYENEAAVEQYYETAANPAKQVEYVDLWPNIWSNKQNLLKQVDQHSHNDEHSEQYELE